MKENDQLNAWVATIVGDLLKREQDLTSVSHELAQAEPRVGLERARGLAERLEPSPSCFLSVRACSSLLEPFVY